MVGNNVILRGAALRPALTLLLVLVVGLLVVEPALAQFGGGMSQNANPVGIGQAIQNSMGGSQYPGAQGMNPQQLQQLMMLRGLQGMGHHHHGVQTGMPMIFDGGPPMMGPMNGGYNNGGNGNTAPDDSARHRSSSEKREALRAVREQQKLMARDRSAQVKAAKSKAPAAKDIAKNAAKPAPKPDANAAVKPDGEPF